MKKMKKLLVILTMTVLSAIAFFSMGRMEVHAEGDVEINKYNFPDPAFRQWILENVDKDKSISISPEENAACKTIYFQAWMYDKYVGIGELTGIKYFTSVTKLDCSDTLIKAIDVSGMTSLETIICHDCFALKSIDASNCTSLVSLDAETMDLFKENETLSSINLSGCTNLTTVIVPAAKGLKSLNVANNKNLKTLLCQGCAINDLRVEGCSNLTYLRCEQNPELAKTSLIGCDGIGNLIATTECMETQDGQTLIWTKDIYNAGAEEGNTADSKEAAEGDDQPETIWFSCPKSTYLTGVYPEGIGLNRDKLTLSVKEEFDLKASFYPEKVYITTLKWTSDNPKIVSVSETGRVTGVAVGSATVTATTVNGLSSKCVVTVDDKPRSISLDKTSATVYYGETLTLKATVLPETAKDKTVSWSSSNLKIAEVAGGVVKPRKAGKATITAKTVNGITAKCEIVVLCENNPSNPFADVKAGGWEFSAAEFVYSFGYMKGKGEVVPGKILFDPYEPVNRSQFVQTIYNYDGRPEMTYEKIFDDVPEGIWYSIPITWAYKKAIVAGKGKVFDVNGKATREQLASMFYNYARFKGYDVSIVDGSGKNIDDFPDRSEVSNWAVTPLKWALSRGIMSGKGSGKLDPQGAATRVECAVMLRNFKNAYPDEVLTLGADGIDIDAIDAVEPDDVEVVEVEEVPEDIENKEDIENNEDVENKEDVENNEDVENKEDIENNEETVIKNEETVIKNEETEGCE